MGKRDTLLSRRLKGAAMEVRECLEKLPFWAELSDEERRFAQRNSAMRRIDAGSLVYSRGHCACVGMVYVAKGSVRAYLMSSEGREITLFRLRSGDSCVLTAACVVKRITVDIHMTAEEPSELMVMNAEAFASLTEGNIHARCFLYESAAESFSSVVSTMEEILFSGFDRRLAAFLLAEAEREGGSEIRMTQSRIAECVNSAREVVTRMLKQFAQKGIVELKRGQVKLLDPDGLRELAK